MSSNIDIQDSRSTDGKDLNTEVQPGDAFIMEHPRDGTEIWLFRRSPDGDYTLLELGTKMVWSGRDEATFPHANATLEDIIEMLKLHPTDYESWEHVPRDDLELEVQIK